MSEFVKTLLIACIPALITSAVTYLIAQKNYKMEIEKAKENFKNQMALLDKQLENNIAEKATDKLFDGILANPEMQRRISQTIKDAPMKKRRHKQ